MTKNHARRGFTIIELVVVITVLGIIAAFTLRAFNPAKRLKQARDSQRKTDISMIANALSDYGEQYGTYPKENGCDASIGSSVNPGPNSGKPCPDYTNGADSWVVQTGWGQSANDYLYQELVVKTKYLKFMPVDPTNSKKYFYKYEPSVIGGAGGNCLGTPSPPNTRCTYWVGTLLEDPKDPTKAIYRCADINELSQKPNCKEVTGTNLSGTTAP